MVIIFREDISFLPIIQTEINLAAISLDWGADTSQLIAKQPIRFGYMLVCRSQFSLYFVAQWRPFQCSHPQEAHKSWQLVSAYMSQTLALLFHFHAGPYSLFNYAMHLIFQTAFLNICRGKILLDRAENLMCLSQNSQKFSLCGVVL